MSVFIAEYCDGECGNIFGVFAELMQAKVAVVTHLSEMESAEREIAECIGGYTVSEWEIGGQNRKSAVYFNIGTKEWT
jgi:hypothetical protein